MVGRSRGWLVLLMIEFDELIAPLSRERFRAEYWGRSFAYLPGQSGRFTALVPWDVLSSILEQHRIGPPRLRLSQNGRSLEAHRYMVAGLGGQPRLDSGKLITCLAQGASMVLDYFDELASPVNGICAAVQAALQVGTYANLYAGWRDQHGFDLHWDAQDSIVLQVSGRKKWRIYSPTRLHPLQDDIEVPVRPAGAPFWEGILEDGDVIYIPRGWWHIAHPLNEPSLHLTITTVPPHGVNLLGWIVGKLRRNAEIRMNVPHLHDRVACDTYVETLREQILKTLDSEVLHKFWQEWEADIRGRPRIRLPWGPYDQNCPISAATEIRLTASNWLSFEIEEDGQIAKFRSSGTLWACPASLVPALGMLSNDKNVSFGALCQKLQSESDAPRLQKSVLALAQAGILLLENERR
jgi:hypothetical protein